MFIGIVLMVYIFVQLAFFAPKGNEVFPTAEEETYAEPTPKFMEYWKLWIGLTVLLILFRLWIISSTHLQVHQHLNDQI